MSGVDFGKWESLEEMMDIQISANNNVSNDKMKRRLCSIIDDLQKNQQMLGDTTPGTDSVIDNASSIPPPKRRRRLNGSTNNTTSSTTNQSDFSVHHNNNNNNQLKHERLSPGTPDTSSRSLTPSSASHPDTPPAQDIMGGIVGAVSPLLPRNYSDIMRSLAAKYNNTNPNEYFSRNGFPSDRYKLPGASSTPYTTHAPPSASNSNSSTDLNTATSPNQSKVLNKQGTNSVPTPLLNPFAASSGIFPPLIDMRSTQALLALVRTAKEAEMQSLLKTVKPRTDSPLDLSSAGAEASSSKRAKTVKATSTPTIPVGMVVNMPGFPAFPVVPSRPTSSSPQSKGPESVSPHQSREDISTWSVDDVCRFVAGIDICAEYQQKFREQSIDGAGLPLLTEEHLVTTMRMRLGPALKLRSLLSKRLGSCAVCLHCNHCHSGTSAQSAVGAGADTSRSAANSIGTVPKHMSTNVGGVSVIRRDSSLLCGEGDVDCEGKSTDVPL